jgi:hypothetical protein
VTKTGMGDTLIESVDASVFTVPTDAPEADGTLTWDSTTMVLVQARARRLAAPCVRPAGSGFRGCGR